MAENKKQVRPGGPHGRGHGYQRPQNLRGTVGKPLAYIGRYKAALIVVAVCLVLSSVGSVASSYFLKPALNHIVAGDFKGLFWMLVAMGGVFLVSAGCSYAYSRIMVRISQRTVATLRQDLFNKLQSLPLRYFDTHQSGDLMSRFTNDMDTVSDMISNSFASVVSNLLTFVCTVVMLVYLNWALTLITFVFLGLMLLVVKGVGGRSRTSFQQQQAALGSLNGYIEEMIEGQKVVQAFGHEAESLAAFDEVNGRLQDVSLKAIFFSSLTNPATRFVNNIVYAGVGLVGALYAVRGGITIGQLSVFLSYANQYTKPFNEISGVVTELQNALACAARVFELLDAEDQVPEAENAAALQPDGHVQLQDVSFRYLPDRPLIEGLSLDVQPGQRIAIVGPTGCGKTTLINLLMRFYDVNGGSIKVSGTDIRDVTRASLRGSYGMVLQDTWLRAGTVRENIAYGKPDATLDEVVAAAKAAHADSFIRRLPEGYDTVIAEDGGNISQGQKQLLCIARVMLCLPPMLILDEATSSIDTRTEVRIQKAFARMMQGRTSFIVAHRLSTIREADLILVMKDGHIVEQGDHDQLLAAGGFYAKLYNSQFEGVET